MLLRDQQTGDKILESVGHQTKDPTTFSSVPVSCIYILYRSNAIFDSRVLDSVWDIHAARVPSICTYCTEINPFVLSTICLVRLTGVMGKSRQYQKAVFLLHWRMFFSAKSNPRASWHFCSWIDSQQHTRRGKIYSQAFSAKNRAAKTIGALTSWSGHWGDTSAWKQSYYPPTPAYSQRLGGEAPGTPQGEAVGQALQNPSKHFQRHVCRCIVVGRGLSVACPRPASPLRMGFSESNVRHFGPPSNPSRQLAGLPLLF